MCSTGYLHSTYLMRVLCCAMVCQLASFCSPLLSTIQLTAWNSPWWGIYTMTVKESDQCIPPFPVQWELLRASSTFLLSLNALCLRPLCKNWSQVVWGEQDTVFVNMRRQALLSFILQFNTTIWVLQNMCYVRVEVNFTGLCGRNLFLLLINQRDMGNCSDTGS